MNWKYAYEILHILFALYMKYTLEEKGQKAYYWQYNFKYLLIRNCCIGLIHFRVPLLFKP